MHRNRFVPLPLRRPLVGLLVCALLPTQALGLLHRVKHANGPTSSQAEPSGHIHGVSETLFAQHRDAGDCQIFDQLSHADGVGLGFIAPNMMPPAQPPACCLPTPRVAAPATGYQARGQPATA